jgi:hypothetical protein
MHRFLELERSVRVQSPLGRLSFFFLVFVTCSYLLDDHREEAFFRFFYGTRL